MFVESAWDFWYLSADKTKEWEERMTKVMTFNTVEDFWACYHHVSLARVFQY
jgi:translation initiation factor 4E